MKSLRLTLSTVLAAAAVATTAQAASYDLTHLAGNAYAYLDAQHSYANTFTLSPYDSASQTVVWAKLSFAFADDNLLGDTILGDAKEYVTVTYDLNSLGLGDVDGSFLLAPLFYDWRSITGSVGSLLVNSLQDGVLSYSVSVSSGDTYLKEVNLQAKTVARQVPDSGPTVALLGLGLLGLIAFKRRK